MTENFSPYRYGTTTSLYSEVLSSLIKIRIQSNWFKCSTNLRVVSAAPELYHQLVNVTLVNGSRYPLLVILVQCMWSWLQVRSWRQWSAVTICNSVDLCHIPNSSATLWNPLKVSLSSNVTLIRKDLLLRCRYLDHPTDMNFHCAVFRKRQCL